jgi:SPP1 family predicted phage head-tail adaptor
MGGWKEDGTWSEVEPVWASIEPLTGKERYDAQRNNPELTHKIVMRYIVLLTPRMRIKYDDPDEGLRYFGIESMADVREARRELHLMCSEQVGRVSG